MATEAGPLTAEEERLMRASWASIQREGPASQTIALAEWAEDYGAVLLATLDRERARSAALERTAAAWDEMREIAAGEHPRWYLPPTGASLVRSLMDECEARAAGGEPGRGPGDGAGESDG